MVSSSCFWTFKVRAVHEPQLPPLCWWKKHPKLPRCHVGDAIRRFLFGAEGREVMGGCCFEDFQSKRLNLTEPPEDTSQIFTDCSFFFRNEGWVAFLASRFLHSFGCSNKWMRDVLIESTVYPSIPSAKNTGCSIRSKYDLQKFWSLKLIEAWYIYIYIILYIY